MRPNANWVSWEPALRRAALLFLWWNDNHPPTGLDLHDMNGLLGCSSVRKPAHLGENDVCSGDFLFA